jgi:CHAT domain-containing protein/Tfp pilus assembly protein PilF
VKTLARIQVAEVFLLAASQIVSAAPVPQSQEDGRVMAAQVAYSAAETLRKRGDPDSLRLAIEEYEEAGKNWGAVGDLKNQAITLSNVGFIYGTLKENAKAIEYYQRARVLMHGLGDHSAEGQILHNIGVAYSALNERQKAVSSLREALPLLEESPQNQALEADSLGSLGRVYAELGQDQNAIEALERAVPIYSSLQDTTGGAAAFGKLGDLYLSTDRDEKALENYANALLLWIALRQKSQQSLVLSTMCLAYHNLAKQSDALENCKDGLRLAREIGDKTLEATASNNIGLVYSSLGDKQKALASYKDALPLWESNGDSFDKAKTLNNMASVFDDLGDKREALNLYSQALTLDQQSGDRDAEATDLNNMAGAYDDLGEKQNSLDYYGRALSLIQQLGKRKAEAVALNNIGRVYSALGDKRKAIEFYEKALPIREEVGDIGGEAGTLINMGAAYLALGEGSSAAQSFKKALPLIDKSGDPRLRAGMLDNLGKFYLESGDVKTAKECFEKALPLFEATGDRTNQAAVLTNLGVVYHDLGRPQTAMEHYANALSLLRATGNRAGELVALNNRATLEDERGNLLDARADLESALKIAESLRTKVVSEELRASYFATVRQSYEFYVDLLMKLYAKDGTQGYDKLALSVSERARARSLLDMLNEAQADIRQGVDPQLLGQERELQASLDATSAMYTRLLNGPHTQQQADAFQKEIGDLLDRYRVLEARIRVASPHYAALTQPQPVTADAIRELMDSNTLLLEYFLGSKQSYLWLVSSSSATAYKIAKREQIEARSRDFLDKLGRGKQISASEVEQAGRELSNLILAPVASKLEHKRLAIVADGILSYIPFGALPATSANPEGGKQQLLILEHEIAVLPSASTLAVLRRETANRPPRSKLVAAIADPVFSRQDERMKADATAAQPDSGKSPSSVASDLQDQQRSAPESGITGYGSLPRLRYSRSEADAVTSFAPVQSRLEKLDFQASKSSAVSPELAQYRFVHFATHGLLNSEHPELSGVVLSLFDEHGALIDGFLRLHDIYNLILPADVVVVSACQSGLGKEVSGEGLVGLTRGFMYAGAQRVVVSLWNINDPATAELMQRFYGGMLKDNLRPAAALKKAQVSMSEDPRWNAPYYWAAFVLQGDWR